MPIPTPDQALAIVEALLARRPDRVEPFKPAVGGNDSHGFRVRAAADELLLKVKKRPGSPVGIYFHSRLAEAGLPVPELVAFGADAGPEGEACAIWEWIDGIPAEWDDDEPCPYDEAEFGELLRRIHDLAYDGPFGLFGDDLETRSFTAHPHLGPVSDSWAGFFHCAAAARHYFDNGYLDRQEADTLASLPDLLDHEFSQAPSRLLHMGDIMHNGNLLLDPESGSILAVIDYVESMAGDPRWELAWMDYYFGRQPGKPFDMTRFRAAYDTTHDPDDRLGRFYLLGILLFEKLLWFDPESPRGRGSIDTVKEILRSFGEL